MMPSLDHCMNNQSEMTTLTKTLEVFDTYKHREDKDSDEESFHLPIDDDESDTKVQEPVRNGNGTETEEDILNKFDSTTPVLDNIDSQLEERLLNEDEEKKESKDKDVVPGVEKDSQSEGTSKDESEKPTEDVGAEEDSVAKTTKETHLENGEVKDEAPVDTKTEESDEVEKSDVPKVDVDEKPSEHSPNASKPSEASASDATPMVDKPTEEEKTVDNNATAKDAEPTKQSTTEEQKDNKSPAEDSSSETKPEEKSDDFSKHNEDSEDLFDISIIRDAEEDNAESAYNEAHPEETQEEQEEFAEDKLEEDSVNGKEEDDEEMDVDKHDDHLKSDDVDIEEETLKLDCDGTKDIISDGESETSNKTLSVQKDDEQKVGEITASAVKSETKCRLDEVTGNLVADDGREIVCEESAIEVSKDNEDSSRSSLKRSLSDESETGPTKKSRTDQPADVENKEVEKPKEKLPLKTLLTLSDFMKTRKHNKRLTMHDLEEFCVQKICEVIVHKSELGDVHHQLKQQEQLIESMRKEIQQLTKQARDLEIVNKKLMNDLKQQTTTQKPLNPLKITRSVGLQVKFTPTFENNLKRRQPNASIVGPKAPQSAQARTPRVVTNTVTHTVNRQAASPQKPQQVLPKPNTPLLSQALQNRRVGVGDSPKVPNQVVRTKSVEMKNPSPSASVIDLTDEDDKRDKNKPSPTKIISPKSITVPLRTTPMRVNATAQGIRLTTSQGKITPITSVVNSSTQQVMYVVQSSPQNVLASSLGGSKAVVVNFQPTNGVLTSALNGSAVSVIPKQGNTIQLKPMPPTKAIQNNKVVKLSNKHPAPLPSPPIVRLASDKPLKPIPPKPHLTIRKTETGIILQWKMPYELDMYEVIASYQLYAYQETSALPSTDMWRKVGDVKALALPMACTLTQFADKNKYYFAVRPVDIHKRIGMFSEPEEISL